MERLKSIDRLRGLAVGLMGLDHVRDFWHNSIILPTDILRTTPALFATRWVTHFCAPVFFMLAGMSLFFALQKSGPKATSRYLVLRGLLLIGLELTLFSRIWTGGSNTFLLQVIWALGVSMIVMAAGIWLRPTYVLVISILLIIGHNGLDALDYLAYSAQSEALSSIWSLLHVSATSFSTNLGFGLGMKQVYVVYPLVPWVAVMGLGFGLGPLMQKPKTERNQWLMTLGSALIVGFFVLRFINVYGDPVPWKPYPSALQTIMSFFNCEKYPPSLIYLAMTLGPSLLALVALEKAKKNGPLTIFGRVPLFFYVLHLPLIDGLRHAIDYLYPDFRGLNLLWTYGIWILVILLLFPLCYAFYWLKGNKTWPWLKYL